MGRTAAQRVVIADPYLLRDIFAAEREGVVEKPDQPPFHAGRVGHPRVDAFFSFSVLTVLS
jgi:hypothetical protein